MRKRFRNAWQFPGIAARTPITGWTEPNRGNTWTEETRSATWTPASSGGALAILVKRASESRTYSMDFSNLPEISGGGSISSITSVVASPNDLTVGATSISGNKAQAVLSAGTDGTQYTVTFTIVTSGGSTLLGIGYLLVDDQ
jgi:hypothetical protein